MEKKKEFMNKNPIHLLIKISVAAAFLAGCSKTPTEMFNLGLRYDIGQGVAQDYSKAFEWYGKAAGAGSKDAMNNIGTLYEKGHGVAQDYTEALEWYQKAASAGDTTAMINLGSLYLNGDGVAQDYATGARLVPEGSKRWQCDWDVQRGCAL